MSVQHRKKKISYSKARLQTTNQQMVYWISRVQPNHPDQKGHTPAPKKSIHNDYFTKAPATPEPSGKRNRSSETAPLKTQLSPQTTLDVKRINI